MSEIEHDPERGVFRRRLSEYTYVETDDTCSICGEKSDEPIICSRCERENQIEEE